MTTIIKNCRECHLQLTDEEIKYYGTRCEVCETDWHHDINDWKCGGSNEKFDIIYTKHKHLNS